MLEQTSAQWSNATSGHARNATRIVSWVLQIGIAGILAQTLFFKFTYATETEVIFADRGGRFAATLVGIAELVCVFLLLVPRTVVPGALLSLAIIGGAIITHLTTLGISIPVAPGSEERDGGLLFLLAVVVAVGSVAVLALRCRELGSLCRRIRSRFFSASEARNS